MSGAEDASPATFSMPYGELEQLIARLVGASAETIRTRFRKVRLRPFPDNIQSGIGVRIQYDLRRILAITMSFEINGIYVPQGHAMSIVEATWPEWCRAVIVAASDANVLARPEEMPSHAGPFLEIGSGVMGQGDAVTVDAAPIRKLDDAQLGIRPAIFLDARRAVASLAQWAESRGLETLQSLREAFELLERDFGWDQPHITPQALEDVPRGRSFIDEGPYFVRALEFLNALPEAFDGQLNRASRLRLERFYGYLERPAPIDAYKKEIGDASSELSLKHYLHIYARGFGIHTLDRYWAMLSSASPRERALELIRKAT